VTAQPIYERAMRDHAVARSIEATAPRAWAALLVGGLMALPLVNCDAGVLHGLGILLRHSPCAASRGKIPQGGRLLWARWTAASVGSALLFGGLAPFLYHHVWGGWHALQIGPWTNYMALSAVGGFTVVETTSARPLRWIVFAFGALCASLSAVCVAVLLQRFVFSRRPPEGGLVDSPQLDQIDGAACVLNAIVLFAFTLANGYGVCRMWSAVLWPSSNARDVYAAAHACLRIGSGSCGGVLLLFYCAPIAIWDPDLIKHSHSFGVAVTGVSYVLLAVCCTRENIARFLGTVSNAVQLRCQPAAGNASPPPEVGVGRLA